MITQIYILDGCVFTAFLVGTRKHIKIMGIL